MPPYDALVYVDLDEPEACGGGIRRGMLQVTVTYDGKPSAYDDGSCTLYLES